MSAHGSQSIQLVILGDTRELHNEISVPPGDILIHTGDFSIPRRELRAIVDFNGWLGKLPHSHKIVVYGDQELALEQDASMRGIIWNARVLRNQTVDIEGVRIWGAAAASLYLTPAGSTESYTTELADMPEQVDVLLTHAPPLGILDCAHGDSVHRGHPELRRAVRRVRPLVHAFSHIPGAYGTKKIGATTFVNAALPGIDGAMSHEPVVLQIPRRQNFR